MLNREIAHILGHVERLREAFKRAQRNYPSEADGWATDIDACEGVIAGARTLMHLQDLQANARVAAAPLQWGEISPTVFVAWPDPQHQHQVKVWSDIPGNWRWWVLNHGREVAFEDYLPNADTAKHQAAVYYYAWAEEMQRSDTPSTSA